jgi:two-component system sensor histidine kinase HydH
MKNLSFFENIKLYVGFTEASSAAHPGARQAITGGQAQIDRLKQTLTRWMDRMLLGPHDEDYYELRARIGRMHVRIALPQQYMFTAMDRIRVRLLDVVRTQITDDPAKVERVATALNQILDLELAIMLETYREDLEAKNRNAERLATIGQFAASIGHELRNPLGVVESSVYLLRQHLRAEAEAPAVKKHLDRIGAEVERASKTIHDLLDLARNRPPQRRKTSLRELVDSAAEASLLPAAVTLHISVPADLTLTIDQDQVRQVLTNLFSNAMQALKGRGQIWVEVEPAADGGTRLRVRDDGPGIPAEARSRIFEALFTTKAKGSGLGLALCRRIMEAHGGTIDAETRPGGASFVLHFPGPQP